MKSRQLIASLIACLPLAAFAHHSGAMYDSSKTVTVSGKITEFLWRNPHSSFAVEVINAEGKPEIWAVEMNAPANLIPLGWKRTTLKPGDKVTVTVRPMRNGTPGGSYVSVKLADGTVLGGTGGSDSAAASPPPAR
jgi:hypothetical protein